MIRESIRFSPASSGTVIQNAGRLEWRALSAVFIESSGEFFLDKDDLPMLWAMHSVITGVGTTGMRSPYGDLHEAIEQYGTIRVTLSNEQEEDDD